MVARAEPLKFTTEPLTKLEPFTVRVSAPEPWAAVDGLSDVSTGTGFVAVTVKVRELEAPPPGVGFVTVTAGVPAVAISLTRMAAVSCVAFM